MADEAAVVAPETAEEAGLVSPDDTQTVRIYEVGYHINPNVKEEELDKVVAQVRAIIEKAGGSFIAEGAPALTRLAYPMTVREGEKNVEYDRGYFGWIKFEAKTEVARSLEQALQRSTQFIRSIVFETVREDTRAKFKAPTLREVKRTDTIHVKPRRAEEPAGPVSEEQLEKALEDITAE